MKPPIDFLTLMELQVVKIMRANGMSLQRVRALRGHWPLKDPPHVFALRSFLEAVLNFDDIPDAVKDALREFMAQVDWR